MPIAIVGIGCRFPGGVCDTSSFWRLLTTEGDAIGEIPPDRFDLAHFYDERPATPGRVMTRWGGFLRDIEHFDAAFFGISPREAERLDPAQRLVLETAWEGLEDAGVDPLRLDGSRTGVFVGQWLSDFEARLFADPQTVDFYMTTGSGRYATSGRLSYLLGLRGPSLTLDTACSSSLVAVHQAVRSLRSGECDLALAGGVNVILQPHISVAYSQSRMMAPDGRCKFADAAGDGYVRSEGAGMVVLKPLATAQADGDRIYAIVRGSAVNNDGRSSGSMGTPSREGQEALLRLAYADAGVAPGDVGYIEAHGTGTRAGDPVELGALARVLRQGRQPGMRAWVGSVKTNLGHTEGAAGLAGFIKVALAIHHGRVPASLHCRQLNPAVDWSSAPFELARHGVDWRSAHRVGGVSAFGIAGTNAHVVLESLSNAASEAAPVRLPARPALLVLSARSRAALAALARDYARLLEGAGRESLEAVCWAAATRRAALEQRAAFIADDAEAMKARLLAFAAGEAATVEGTVHRSPARAPVLIVPGQGGQWPGMACDLMDREPVFRETLEACDAAARPWLGVSLIEQLRLHPSAPDSRMERIEFIQPALLAVCIAAARWLESVGIVPSALVGHSMGEVGAAHLGGVIDLGQAMRIVCRRSALMGRTSGLGAMAMVDLPIAEARVRLTDRQDLLSVAVSNSPRSCVVSGEPAALREWMTQLERDGVFCRLVKVDVASHSPQMDGPAADLSGELAGLQVGASSVPLFSTVLAREVEGGELGAAYWGRNLREPVRFAETLSSLIDLGATSFIELGPHPVLAPAVLQTAQSKGQDACVLTWGRREEPEVTHALAVVAGLWAAGHQIDWYRLLPACPRWPDLPMYPWQRERHWVRQALPRDASHPTPAPAVPDDQASWLNALRWVESPHGELAGEAAASAPPQGPWLLVCAEDAVADTASNALRSAGAGAAACTPQALPDVLARSCPAAVVVCLDDQPGAAYRLVSAMQVIVQAPGCSATRLWAATIGAQDVPAHAGHRVAVHAAAAWGAGRVLADEHPQHWGGLVDLDPQADNETRARQLAQHLLSSDVEPQAAWRRGQRFVLRLVSQADAAGTGVTPPWRADGAYLVTGGLGEVGLRVASAMVMAGVRRLVLMGRHGLPPRQRWRDADLDARTSARVAAVRALESAGAAVHVIEADVADARDTERALRDYEAAAWPPIRGVVHAAGVLESQLALQVDPGSFDRVLAPKLQGALHLDRLLPQLDSFILFSSIIAVLGVAGTAAYAAANAGLDALAADRRARGLPALSIQWGAWEGLGMLAGGTGRSHMEGLRALGVQGFSPDQGAAWFNALAGRAEASLCVTAMDWQALRSARRDHVSALLRGREDIGTPEMSAAGLAQRLAGLGAAQRRTLIEPAVRDAVGAVLKLAPSRIDPRKALGAMGLNSLMALELRNRLEVMLGQPLSATLAWNYPSVEALAGYLSGLASAADTPGPVPVAEPVATTVTAPALAAVSALSDEEAAQLLRRRR